MAKAVVALPRQVNVHLPRPHAAQQTVIDSAKRFNVLCCGRRWGKTTLEVDRVIQPALAGYPVAWFSPTYKMLTEVWREVGRVLQPVTARTSAQEHRLELTTGGVVDMWSLDSPDVTRGRKYARIAIDEAAMVRGLEDAWQEVIRPTLADYQGDAWFASSPKGHNFFKALWDRGQDDGYPDWASWKMPTGTNPFIAATEIEAARRELPERIFAQEFNADFLEFDGAVFRYVQQAAVNEPEDPLDGHSYVIGCDWGKLSDFSCFSVMDATNNRQVWQERFNQIDYRVQEGRLVALCERYRPVVVVAERNSMGEPIIESLLRRGLPVEPFTTTNATKAAIIETLALSLERGDITILNDPVLVAELQAFEATRLPSGMLRYSAPEGQHDDTVMALALANAVIAPGPSDGMVVYDDPEEISPI